jgi:hypothetical protein
VLLLESSDSLKGELKSWSVVQLYGVANLIKGVETSFYSPSGVSENQTSLVEHQTSPVNPSGSRCPRQVWWGTE